MSRISGDETKSDSNRETDRDARSRGTAAGRDDADDAEEFGGLENGVVNAGEFTGVAPPEKGSGKDPSLPVDEAFRIDSRNLHRSTEREELEEAVASLD